MNNLRMGNTISCGCEQRKRTSTANFKHGEVGTPLFRIWKGMKQRCSDPRFTDYAGYGGRGITVCAEWLEFVPFRDWALSHGYVSGLTIDRVDNDLGYSPENCRWATASEQARNRRSNRWITAFGETKVMADWAEDERCAVSNQVLGKRVRGGWETEAAITTPPHRSNRPSKHL